MQDLIRLMEKYQPGVSSGMVPASNDDIRHLEASAGPLPGAYVRFLQAMGKSTGEFAIHSGNADLSSDGLAKMPRIFVWLKGSNLLYIGQDNSPDASDYFLDRGHPSGLDDCWVVQMSLNPPVNVQNAFKAHIGIEEMLYYEAFDSIRLPLLPHHAELTHSTDGDPAHWPKARAVNELAERLGFERIPPAQRCALYERGDAALLLYQKPDSPLFRFKLAARDASDVIQLAETFVRELGVTVSRKFVFELVQDD